MDLLLRIIVPNISTEYFSRIFGKKKVKKNIWKVVNFLHLLQNHAPTKPSSKEYLMKLFKVHSTTKCGMHKSIKLNYFEHNNTFESCKQASVNNRSSHFILEMVYFLERKI